MQCIAISIWIAVMLLTCPIMPTTTLARADQDNEDGLNQSEDIKWNFGWLVEFSYDYYDVTDTADKDSGTKKELYFNSAELTVEAQPHEWLAAKIVAGIEESPDEEETQAYIDEAILSLTFLSFHAYGIIGKHAQPFGILENHLISDTIIEELYEIDTTGVTLGIAPEALYFDLSFTVYDEEPIIEALEDFGTHEFSPSRTEDNEKMSYIVNLSFDFDKIGLLLSSSYDNSAGDGRDNETFSAGLSWANDFFTFDVEYGSALQRELGDDGKENLESAWYVAITSEPIEPVEISARYESFDDDRKRQQDEIMDYRYSAGLNIGLSEELTLSLEYRYTSFEREVGSIATDSQNEAFVELAWEIENFSF